MSSNIEELESLLFDWESGSLGSDGVERIRAILRQDESARTFFARQQMLSAALRLESDAGLGPPPTEAPTPDAIQPVTKTRSGSLFRRSYTIAAATVPGYRKA